MTAVSDARCVLFAYHEMGHECMAVLLKLGAPLVALFTHQDDPHEEIWWKSCTELARQNSIPVYTPDKLDRDWEQRLAQLHPDVIYSFSYRYLIGETILNLARLGAYNLHPSLLPRYRGRAPVNWVLVNGERETGVTLHHMVTRADAGDIVGQAAVAIDDQDTALTLYRKLVPAGANLIERFHPQIVAAQAPRIRQDLSLGNYVGRRRPEDGRIDWSKPARTIFNLVRAVTHPYPGAFCTADGRKLMVWQSRIAAETGSHGVAGHLEAIRGDGSVEIACGEGSLALLRVEFENDGEKTAADALGAIAEPRILK